MTVSIEKEKAFENIQYELLKGGWWTRPLSQSRIKRKLFQPDERHLQKIHSQHHI